MNMKKCNWSDLNAVGDKVGSLQHEITQFILLVNESLKMNITKEPTLTKQNRYLEIMN